MTKTVELSIGVHAETKLAVERAAAERGLSVSEFLPRHLAPLSGGYRLSREPTIETTLKPHVMQIRLIKHEAVPQCGSYEVRFSDDRPSKYFYWDDVSSQRFRPEMLTGEQAAQKAKSFARAGRDEIG